MLRNIENKDMKKILLVLAKTHDSAPLGYISLYTGIKEPLSILEEMEKKDLVRQIPSSKWSCCMGPTFELTPKTRKELFENIVY